MPKSYKPQVQTDNTGKWYDNALRFATRDEALDNARDLMGRWMLVVGYGAAPSEDPVNYAYVNHKLVEVQS